MSGELISTSLPNREDIWTGACDDNSKLLASTGDDVRAALSVGLIESVMDAASAPVRS